MKKRPPWLPAHLVRRPPEDGLRRLLRDIAPGSAVVRIRRLGGGLKASTHALTLERRSGRPFDVVLKRFAERDEEAPVEWARTVYAQRLDVPAPEPIAFDSLGHWFGAPAIVLSRLAGRAKLRFGHETERSYAQIAETILAISAASTRRLPKAVRGPIAGRDFRLPSGLRRTSLVERALATIRRLLPQAMTEELVMSHGDFHPGNMLWSRGRLAGLVDWGYANLAYRTREVVYCRTELALLSGAREADRFLATYERIAGHTLEHVRAWDLMQGLTAMRWSAWWAYAYREQGRSDLTDEIARRRAANVVRRALSNN